MSKLNQAIIGIRCELQSLELKKSGKNKFAGFEYFELSDFLPTLNELMRKYQINDQLEITKEYAHLHLISGEEKQTYTIPFMMFETPLNKSGQQSMQPIQYLGAINTYYKRYLYLNAFGITDGDIVDALDGSKFTSYKTYSKANAEDKKRYWTEFKDYLETRDVEVAGFNNFLDIADDQQKMFNSIVKFLKDKTLFDDQIESYKKSL